MNGTCFECPFTAQSSVPVMFARSAGVLPCHLFALMTNLLFTVTCLLVIVNVCSDWVSLLFSVAVVVTGIGVSGFSGRYPVVVFVVMVRLLLAGMSVVAVIVFCCLLIVNSGHVAVPVGVQVTGLSPPRFRWFWGRFMRICVFVAGLSGDWLVIVDVMVSGFAAWVCWVDRVVSTDKNGGAGSGSGSGGEIGSTAIEILAWVNSGLKPIVNGLGMLISTWVLALFRYGVINSR